MRDEGEGENRGEIGRITWNEGGKEDRRSPFRGLSSPRGASKTTKEVRDLARNYGPAAIYRLACLAGLVVGPNNRLIDKAASEQVQVAAANILLERAYGKAKEVVGLDDDVPEGKEVQFTFRIVDAPKVVEATKEE